MFNVEALRQFLSVETFLGIQTAVVILLAVRLWNGSPAMFAQWIAYKRAKAEEKASDWKRLRDEVIRLDDAAKRWRDGHDECARELLDVKTRLAIIEGYQIGRGQAAQDVAIIQGAKRIQEGDGPRGGGK